MLHTRPTLSPAMIFALVILAPAVAQGTQGAADSCMIVTIGLFGIPAAFAMIGLGISSIVRLRRKSDLRPDAGRTVLALSMACLGLFSVRVVYCMSVADWDSGFSRALLLLSSPILVLSLASAVLAWMLRRRARVAVSVVSPRAGDE